MYWISITDTKRPVPFDPSTMHIRKILSLYFPRSPQEEREGVSEIPEDIGNEMGEPIIPERRIRIVDKPTTPSSEKSGLWSNTGTQAPLVYCHVWLKIMYSCCSCMKRGNMGKTPAEFRKAQETES